MQWLLHTNVHPAVAELLHVRGDQVHQLSELGLTPDAAPGDVIAAARQKQWDLVTLDPDLANAPFEGNLRYDRSMVFLQAAGDQQQQEQSISRLFDRYKRLVPCRLYTVTAGRVKIRQLPGACGAP